MKSIPDPQTKSKRRTETQQAVIELRKTRQLTQQGLAVHMGRTTTTIGRWEAIRPPHGFSLVELAKVARDFGREDLAAIFEQELQQESAVIADIGGLGALAHQLGLATPATLEIAVRNLFECARADPSGRSGAYRAYRKLLSAIAAYHAVLVQEAAQGRVVQPHRPNYLKSLEHLQFEIETMEEEEDKRHARK